MPFGNQFALPRPPQIGGPQPGPRGGIYQQPGMPYQPNPAAEAMQGIGSFLTSLGQQKQQNKQKAKSEFEQGMQMRASGLPVADEKLEKLAKKAGLDNYFDFNSPILAMPQGGASAPMPQQMPPQGPPQPGVPPPEMLQGAGMIGGGMGAQAPPQDPRMPQLPTHSQPQASIMGPQSIQAPQPGMMERMGNVLGFGGGDVNRQSEGARTIRGMTGAMDRNRQMQQTMQSGQNMEKMATLSLGLASMGIGMDGRPVSPESQEKARYMRTQLGTLPKLEGDDLTSILKVADQMAGPNGADPEVKREYAESWVMGKVGSDKKLDAATKIATHLIDSGESPAKAYDAAFKIASGKAPAELPKFNQKALAGYFKEAMELHDMYPGVSPDVWQSVHPFLLAGDRASALKLLGKAPTKGDRAEARATRNERRADIGIGLEQARNKIAQGNLSVAQGNLGLAGKKFAEEQSQNQFSNQARIIGTNLELIRTGKKEMTDEQMTNMLTLMSNLVPGYANVRGRQDPWGSGNEPPQLIPRKGGDTGGQSAGAADAGMQDYIMNTFYPALMEAIGGGTSGLDPITKEPINPLVY